MENKIAHLTFIQGVITRMGSNSFLLKGWSVTLTAAIFALAAQNANPDFALVAYFPVIMFWALDGFFLHQEKLFRELYSAVATGKAPSDFSMNTEPYKSAAPSYFSVLFSKTLLPFHGVVFGVILIVMLCILKPI